MKRFNNAKDMTWSFCETGLLAYSKEEIYYWGVNTKKEYAKSVKRIDLKINKDRLYVKTVIGWPNNQYILISMSTAYDENIVVVWNLIENQETWNYSLQLISATLKL